MYMFPEYGVVQTYLGDIEPMILDALCCWLSIPRARTHMVVTRTRVIVIGNEGTIEPHRSNGSEKNRDTT